LLPGQHSWPAPPQVEQTDDDEVPPQTKPPAVQMGVVELLLVLGVV